MTAKKPAIEAALRRAQAELVAAYAIEAEGSCDTEAFAVHIVRGWALVRAAVDKDVPAIADAALGEWARGQSVRFVGEENGEMIRRFVDQAAPLLADAGAQLGADPSPSKLELQLRALSGRLGDERRRAGVAPPLVSRAGVWAKRLGVVGAAVLAVVVVGLRPWQLQGVGQWRGAYYPGKDLRGEPDIYRTPEINFDWGVAPPTDSIPSDRFAARWDTCLVMDEAQEVAFQLVADDGARFFIDGEMVIDAWDLPEPPVAVGQKVNLEPGVHHLRVEFHEESLTASAHFMASFDLDLPPGAIPSRMLQYPAEDIDAEDQCGHVEP